MLTLYPHHISKGGVGQAVGHLLFASLPDDNTLLDKRDGKLDGWFFSAAPFPVPPYPQYMCQLIVIPIFSVCNCVDGFAVVERRVAQYVYQRGTTYYFVRRVPKDVQECYKSLRIVICLKTSRKDRAVRAGMSIAQRLEDYWLSLRLSKLDIPALHLLRDKPLSLSSSMQLSEALELYLRLKGVG